MTVFKRNVHLGTKDPLIETDDVADKAVTTEKIGDGAVTSEKISKGGVEWKNISEDVQNTIASMEKGGVALSGEFGDSELIGINQKKLTEVIGPEGTLQENINNEAQRAGDAEEALSGRVSNLETTVGRGGSIDERIAAAKTDIRNNTIVPIDNRLSTIEELAEISVSGGTIGIATKSDFDNPTQEQKTKIPTINALLEVGLISNKKEESPAGIVTIKPNTLYKFGTCSSLAIAFYSDASFANAIKEYMFEFTVSGTEFTLTLPEGVRWNEEPDLENGYTYQVSIIDNLAVFGEFEPLTTNE